MVVSKRERYIAMGALAVAALVAFDQLLLGPLLSYRDGMDARQSELATDIAKAEAAIARGSDIMPQWNAMRAGLQPGPAEAESQILHAVRDWAEDARLDMSLVRPERLPERLADKTRLPEITVHAAGTGSMEAVSRFMWRLETARLPVRMTELQLAPRKEGTDDLNAELQISTIYLPRRPAAPKSAEAKK